MKESGENYLEAIYLISKRKEGVHALDVAKELNFSKPSITRAMGILKKQGFITIDDKKHILLTQKGTEKAEQIYIRHKTITQLLTLLGVSEKTADEDACKIEHSVSEETFDKILSFVNKNFN